MLSKNFYFTRGSVHLNDKNCILNFVPWCSSYVGTNEFCNKQNYPHLFFLWISYVEINSNYSMQILDGLHTCQQLKYVLF